MFRQIFEALKSRSFKNIAESLHVAFLANKNWDHFLKILGILVSPTMELITSPLIGINMLARWLCNLKEFLHPSTNSEHNVDKYVITFSTFSTTGIVTAIVGGFIGFALAPIFLGIGSGFIILEHTKSFYENYNQHKKYKRLNKTKEAEKYRTNTAKNMRNIIVAISILVMVSLVIISPIGPTVSFIAATTAGILTLANLFYSAYKKLHHVIKNEDPSKSPEITVTEDIKPAKAPEVIVTKNIEPAKTTDVIVTESIKPAKTPEVSVTENIEDINYNDESELIENIDENPKYNKDITIKPTRTLSSDDLTQHNYLSKDMKRHSFSYDNDNITLFNQHNRKSTEEIISNDEKFKDNLILYK